MTQAIDIILKGGIVMIPLLACSLISLALTIEHLIFLGTGSGHNKRCSTCLRWLRPSEFDRALKTRQGLCIIPSLALWLRIGAPQSRTGQRRWKPQPRRKSLLLKSRLGTLDTIVTLAPLLGLHGTVVGMIGSFNIMSEAGMGQPHAVTGGVAEALIAIASGLLIAILTLIPYNYFSMRVEKEMDAMEHFSSSLELLLHEQPGKY